MCVCVCVCVRVCACITLAIDWGRCSSSSDDANLLGIVGAWVGQSLSGQACDFCWRKPREVGGERQGVSYRVGVQLGEASV